MRRALYAALCAKRSRVVVDEESVDWVRARVAWPRARRATTPPRCSVSPRPRPPAPTAQMIGVLSGPEFRDPRALAA